MHGVTVTELIQRNHFKNLTPEINTDEIIISASDINRPALPLTGFFAHFDNARLQVIGNAETEYIGLMDDARKCLTACAASACRALSSRGICSRTRPC